MKRLLLIALVANAAAFKFLSNFKAKSVIPRPSSMFRRRKAAKVYGTKKLAVITGASSGLGLQTAAELLSTGEYHVFGAVRDVDKMMNAARDEDFPMDDFTPLEVDLNSFDSVNDFCDKLEKTKLNRPIDRLICNAAVYNPEAEWSEDDHDQTQQVNYLSHFLMVSRLMPGMIRAPDPRIILIGEATAEDSVAVYPPADLGALDGFKAGFKKPISMPDGFNYQGDKAYKDSKLCLSTLSTMLHDRYHKQTGIAYSTVCPGRIASPSLFEGVPSPEPFSISTSEAARRLFQVAHDGRCSKSGVCWSWLEGQAYALLVPHAWSLANSC
jgi:light-dependent protochlorophyllide reductase